jgi:TctA family transporter
MPLILIFCVVGSFAINNSVHGVGLMLAMGVLAYLMEAISRTPRRSWDWCWAA